MKPISKRELVNSKPVIIAKDKNANAKPIGLQKPNAGFAKHILWIAEDAFTEDLRP